MLTPKAAELTVTEEELEARTKFGGGNVLMGFVERAMEEEEADRRQTDLKTSFSAFAPGRTTSRIKRTDKLAESITIDWRLLAFRDLC